MKIAVVGAGISGLAAAWMLSRTHQVTLFEAQSRPGGHADTQLLTIGTRTVPVDTGFIVLNDRNYPQLSALFAALDVPTRPTEMSFAVSMQQGGFEYGGASVGQLFAQRANLVRPRMWRMLWDILRFYRQAQTLLDCPPELTLGEFLARENYSAAFIRDHILPMGAAIWSACPATIRGFPAASFGRFCHNHGLLNLHGRPQWASVIGGSQVYVSRITQEIAARATVALGCKVEAAERRAHGISLRSPRGQEPFDALVLACHADQALALLADPQPAERAVLSMIRSTDNVAVLHSDTSFMPRRRAVWSAWNYLAEPEDPEDGPVGVTYWMNRLQGLEVDQELFVTLNPRRPPHHVHATRHYRHPQFDAAAIAAQAALPAIQGSGGVWYAGAWTGWGFHEDGIASAMRIAAELE